MEPDLSLEKTMNSNICIVCSKSGSKYKCPKCRDSYCSVACCKVHRDLCKEEEKSAPSKDEDDSKKNENGTKTLSGVDVLSSQQMEKLSKDPYISKMLRSKRLREHINAIDSAKDRAGALKTRRKSNVEFHTFAQKVLETITHGE